MSIALSHYLESIRSSLRLDVSDEKEIINELETHIEDTLQELAEAGLSEEEAAGTCLGLLGSTKLVAHQLYETHSQGTWKQASLASTPHLLFGLLFALNWWQHIFWLSLLLALTLGAIVYGWWHGKPTWVFPWLGYSLVPVLAVGLILIYLPSGWTFLAIPLYFGLALWWLHYIVIQTARRDWLFSSLMLLPIPIITAWYLAISPEGKFHEYTIQHTYEYAPWIGLSFLALALTISAFIRLRQRWLRKAILVVSGLATLTAIACFTNGRLALPAFLVLIIAMWGLFLIPPLLERWEKKRWTQAQERYSEYDLRRRRGH